MAWFPVKKHFPTFSPLDHDVFGVLSPPDDVGLGVTPGVAGQGQVVAFPDDRVGWNVVGDDLWRNWKLIVIQWSGWLLWKVMTRVRIPLRWRYYESQFNKALQLNHYLEFVITFYLRHSHLLLIWACLIQNYALLKILSHLFVKKDGKLCYKLSSLAKVLVIG